MPLWWLLLSDSNKQCTARDGIPLHACLHGQGHATLPFYTSPLPNNGAGSCFLLLRLKTFSGQDQQKTRRRPAEEEEEEEPSIASKYTPTNNNTATTTTTLGSLYIFTFAYSHTIKHSEYQHPYYYTRHDEVFLLCAPLCVVFFSLKCLCQMPDASLSFYWRPTGALPSIES